MDLAQAVADLQTFAEFAFTGCGKQMRTQTSLELAVRARLHDAQRKTHMPAGRLLSALPEEADGLRQRLNRAYLNDWSDELVRRRLEQLARQAIPDAVAFIIDDTGFEKKGDKSPGVQRQYTGTAGKVTNCQIVVSTHLASHTASVPLEMDLYLPKSWCGDRQRCREAGIPEEVGFRTKPNIALDQLDRILTSGVGPDLALADASYGDDTGFRAGLAARGMHYALGVSSSLKVWRPDEGPDPPASYSGRGPRPKRRFPGVHHPVEVAQLATELAADAWVSVDLRPGQPNPRTSRFARLRVRHAHRAIQGREPGPEEWLVIEWPEDEEAPTHYFLSSLPKGLGIQELAILCKLRWRVERDYQDAKREVGLDQYEGRRWVGFNHHLTICMASMTFLAASRSLFPLSNRADSPELPSLAEVRRRLQAHLRRLLGFCPACQQRVRRLRAPPPHLTRRGEGLDRRKRRYQADRRAESIK